MKHHKQIYPDPLSDCPNNPAAHRKAVNTPWSYETPRLEPTPTVENLVFELKQLLSRYDNTK